MSVLLLRAMGGQVTHGLGSHLLPGHKGGSVASSLSEAQRSVLREHGARSPRFGPSGPAHLYAAPHWSSRVLAGMLPRVPLTKAVGAEGLGQHVREPESFP